MAGVAPVGVTLIRGDCFAALDTLPDNSIDAGVSDPPYGLSQEPDMAEVLGHWLAGDDYKHRGGGFMGKAWDSFVPGPATWRKVFAKLKPGGHLLVFAGTRTHGLMEMALRLAGFEIRDCFESDGWTFDALGWRYGSGFPKSLNIGAGWGTALKPAHEPIIVARKPVVGTLAANVLRYGVGGLNIDGCRLAPTTATYRCAECGHEEQDAPSTPEGTCPACGSDRMEGVRVAVVSNHSRSATAAKSKGIYGDSRAQETHQTEGQKLGRWPANVLLTHHPECAEACAPGCPVAVIDAQSGQLTSGKAEIGTGSGPSPNQTVYAGPAGGTVASCYADSGGASRFFSTFAFGDDDAVPFLYCAKASRAEREAGCEDLPARSGAEAVDREEGTDGLKSPRAGAGRTAKEVHNFHPTVKPVALLRWLVKLVTPLGGTVLDPFMGSGTTGVACVREGFNFVGVDLDSDGNGGEAGYVRIAEARIRHAGGDPIVRTLTADTGTGSTESVPANDRADRIPVLRTEGARMSKPLPPVFITDVEHTIKLGGKAKFGPRTLIVGPNGSGKSSYLHAVELACSKTANDLLGRDEVTSAAMLIALAPANGPLVAKCALSNNTVASYTLDRKPDGGVKTPSAVQPMVVNFPVRAVRNNLNGGVDKARKWLLSMIAGEVTRKDIHDRLGDPTLPDAYDRAAAAAYGAGNEIERLLASIEYVGKQIRKEREAAKLATEMGKQRAAALTAMPTDAQIAEAAERVKATAALAEAAKGAAGVTLYLDGLRQRAAERQAAAERAVAAYQYTQMAERGLYMGAEPPPAGDGLEAVRAAVAATMQFHVDRGLDTCGICANPLAPMRRLGLAQEAEAIRAVDAMLNAKAAAWAEYTAAQKAMLDAYDVATKAVAEFNEAQATLAAEEQRAAEIGGLDAPAAAASFEAAQADYNALVRAQSEWRSVRQYEAEAADHTRGEAEYQLLDTALSKVVGDLLQTAVARFESAVQAYLPADDVFRLRLTEMLPDGTTREVCQYGFERERNGVKVLEVAASGAEEIGLYFALGAAAFGTEAEKPGTMNVFIAPDRAWDPNRLREELIALRDIPGQVIVTSTCHPAGKLPAGWTLVELGENPRKRRKAATAGESAGGETSGSTGGETSAGEAASAGATAHATGNGGVVFTGEGSVAGPVVEVAPVIMLGSGGAPMLGQDGQPLFRPTGTGTFNPEATIPGTQVNELDERGWTREQQAQMNAASKRIVVERNLAAGDYSVIGGGVLWDNTRKMPVHETIPGAK